MHLQILLLIYTVSTTTNANADGTGGGSNVFNRECIDGCYANSCSYY